WPSSPSIGWGHPESLTEGDSHYWGVWWGEQPFEVYNEKVGRFMSEYGFQGMPTLETLRSMFLMMKPDFSLRNPVIKNHEKHTRGWEIIETYMKRDYNVPDYFVDYQYVSQLLQARGIKMAIEAHRRAKPYNMGTLYWQLNDCWPAVSWSSIDYLGNWKALHYQVKRSFAPQIILTEEKENTLHFYAVNDDLKEYENVHLEVEVIKFDGKVLNKLDLKSSEKIFKGIIKFEPIKSAFHSLRNETFLKLILKDQSDNIIAQNNYFFSQPKDLKLAQPHIQITKIAPDEIEISTDVLAKDLYLMSNTSENTIKETHFSDNFFDLLPNEKKRIKLSKPLEKVKVMSLWDVMRY
ncbi:glycoside hydrolase family 2 protein, partial [Chryseobacterium sp.]|uniref:glycoside hydrolase family 2 protein n=1 Tax=Chryseobacterium sp. TaxID=1871047 RepID=UPI00343F6E04